jgi:hypothetical protein
MDFCNPLTSFWSILPSKKSRADQPNSAWKGLNVVRNLKCPGAKNNTSSPCAPPAGCFLLFSVPIFLAQDGSKKQQFKNNSVYSKELDIYGFHSSLAVKTSKGSSPHLMVWSAN